MQYIINIISFKNIRIKSHSQFQTHYHLDLLLHLHIK